MSEGVLISIHPKWCEKIANGKKKVEVRKTRPKMDTPFKCYIYCSSVKSMNLQDYVAVHQATSGAVDDWGGKVIGEFTCDRIYELEAENCHGGSYYAKGRNRATTNMIVQQSCLDIKDMHNYLHGKNGYAWHISDFVLYDTPKKLECFCKLCQEELHCESCAMYNENKEQCGNEALRLHRAPQSWQYVEESGIG